MCSTAACVVASPPGNSEARWSLKTTDLNIEALEPTPWLYLSRGFGSACYILSTLRCSGRHYHLHNWTLDVCHLMLMSLCCRVGHICVQFKAAVQLWTGFLTSLTLCFLSCQMEVLMPVTVWLIRGIKWANTCKVFITVAAIWSTHMRKAMHLNYYYLCSLLMMLWVSP